MLSKPFSTQNPHVAPSSYFHWPFGSFPGNGLAPGDLFILGPSAEPNFLLAALKRDMEWGNGTYLQALPFPLTGKCDSAQTAIPSAWSHAMMWLKMSSTNLTYVSLDIHTHLFRARLDSRLEFSSPAVKKKKRRQNKRLQVKWERAMRKEIEVGKELVH